LRVAPPVLRGQSWDFIVPVPLHPLKEREREFNQAEIFARRLAAATTIPLHTKLLSRIAPTATQTLLSREQRARNMANAFTTPAGLRLDGKRIVIVDDIFTTGATTNDCARALREAEAADVCVWTVARGL
jgi:ComF family protein